MTHTMIVILIGIASFCVLGIIFNVYKLVSIKKKRNFIIEYSEKIGEYPSLTNPQESACALTYIIMNASDASDDMFETESDIPIYELVNLLAATKYYQEDYEKLNKRIAFNSIKAAKIYEKRRNKHYWYFTNPFTLFYQGVELVLIILFGYPIKKIDADFDFEGKAWRIIVGVISFVGGIASIVSLSMEMYKICVK